MSIHSQFHCVVAGGCVCVCVGGGGGGVVAGRCVLHVEISNNYRVRVRVYIKTTQSTLRRVSSKER